MSYMHSLRVWQAPGELVRYGEFEAAAHARRRDVGDADAAPREAADRASDAPDARIHQELEPRARRRAAGHAAGVGEPSVLKAHLGAGGGVEDQGVLVEVGRSAFEGLDRENVPSDRC